MTKGWAPPVRRGQVLTRRTMLRGLLGGAAVALGLPLFDAVLDGRGQARANGSLLPKRFGVWMWGNGVLPDRWNPTATGDDWPLSVTLAPLAAVKPKLTVVSGMSVRVPNLIPHFSGPAGLLTGLAPLGEEGNNTYAGPTLDQVIAAEIGGETRYRSLQTGVFPGVGHSFNGPNNVNPPETSPHALFDRLFGAGFTAPGEERIVDPRLALRRSVLDAVGDQVVGLQGRLGTADRARLDQHLTGIRDLELRLARMEAEPPNLEACARPEAPPAEMTYEDLSSRNRALADLMVMALACDQTRVFGHYLTLGVNNYVYPGTSSGHHQNTHDEADPQAQVEVALDQIIHELGYFLEALDAVPEGGETLLDHCVVLCTTDCSLGRTHSLDDYPIVLAGSANGALRTNHHYRSATRENASMLVLSLLRAMGLSRASWGVDDAQATSSLAAVEA